jgi:hypothetical protein
MGSRSLRKPGWMTALLLTAHRLASIGLTP